MILARATLDAFSAGKHVFCEKSLAYTIEECQAIADAYRGSKRVFQIGHQRLFSPTFLRALEWVRNGAIGPITQIRAYWHRNNNWRNPVPDPSLDRRLNWRLYREYSCGLMTELASHHMQVANWFLGAHPVSCVGYGSINYWKDGREVYDNVNVLYRYADGTHVVYDSLTSNKFYGMEVQVMGPKGLIEAEAGRLYAEAPPPAPGIVQLINSIERGFFETVPIGGPSWVPDLKRDTKGVALVQEKSTDDGTAISLAVFANAIRLGEPVPGMMEQACRSGVCVLMGLDRDGAAARNRMAERIQGMTDICISGRRLVHEVRIYTTCVLAALLLNMYSIIRFKTEWKELFTTLHITLALALAFFVVVAMVRGAVFCGRLALRKAR